MCYRYFFAIYTTLNFIAWIIYDVFGWISGSSYWFLNSWGLVLNLLVFVFFVIVALIAWLKFLFTSGD
jgi:hypothetical protein